MQAIASKRMVRGRSFWVLAAVVGAWITAGAVLFGASFVRQKPAAAVSRITTSVTLRGHVVLPARPAPPDPRWSVPLTVTLHLDSGGLSTFTPTTDLSGYFTI